MKSPLQAMRDLLNEDTRYKIEAYQFIREALQYAHENIDEQDLGEQDIGEEHFMDLAENSAGFDHDDFDPASFDENNFGAEEDAEDSEAKRTASRHITGQQLSEACRQYAVEQYGYLARIVLGTWGIHCTGDFGELVYNLIRIEQMRKSDSDRREDFDDVFDFEDAFSPQFELAIESET